jgi:predicted transcriptional regulator
MKISIEDFKSDRTLSQHSRKSKEVARALDAKAKTLTYAKVFTSYEFEDFLSQLTPKRFELLRLASKGGRSILDLAAASHRDPSAVSKDVARLSKLGLVRVEAVRNDGHGQKKSSPPWRPPSRSMHLLLWVDSFWACTRSLPLVRPPFSSTSPTAGVHSCANGTVNAT